MFADEPPGALDSLAGEQVLAEMLRVSRQSGTAVVLVTPSLEWRPTPVASSRCTTVA